VPEAIDVLIAGGGVMGSACAYFLHADCGYRGSIMVVEADPSYAKAASSRSASSIRLQFSSKINIELSDFGMQFLRSAPAEMGLVESSYLYLATRAGFSQLERRVQFQRGASVPVSLHESAALAARYPWLRTDDLAAGADTAGGEGWFDGHALLSRLRLANERAGIRYVRDRVLGLERGPAGAIDAVRLERHGILACGIAVNCAGTGARELAASAGIDLPVFARKRNVFVFSCKVPIPGCPLVIDPSGLWFRPEGDKFLCGPPSDPDPDVAEDDMEPDIGLFEGCAWPILAHRVPAFEAVRLQSAWAGHYDYNSFDQNAFVGPVPGIDNLLLANGFSGHGLQHAPGIGRGLAELIHYGRYRTIDLTPLSYARLAANTPLREANVI
jgi:FAD-dependent oxidoreductase domain-containing protein 1